VSQQKTLYWYDLETFGIEPKRDRISQFAGVRTDENLNIVGEPLTLFCKLPEEILPEPMSCLVTGITPEIANERGLLEKDFVQRIYQEFSQPDTCVVGYNNIRFDDEFMRYGFYRNFYDPYEREWKNGNSRWDIIDMVRLTHALRPDGINWPKHENGTTSFRLELLTKENNISHDAAHDALSDVYATIAFARLIKETQPKLYDYAYSNRSKQYAAKMMNVRQMTPILHVSSKYPASQHCTAVVAPLAMHPTNKNAYIVYDLSVSPTQLLELKAEEIKKRVFTPSSEMPENVDRVPLKAIHINKCPVLAPLSTLDSASAKRIGIKLDVCLKNLQTIKQSHQIREKIRSVFSNAEFEKETDAEYQLYDGFFSDRDKMVFEEIRNYTLEQIKSAQLHFEDSRLAELLLRYKARNYPGSLNDEEQLRWDEYQQYRLFSSESEKTLTIKSFRERIEELKADPTQFPERRHILDEISEYADQISEKYQAVPA